MTQLVERLDRRAHATLLFTGVVAIGVGATAGISFINGSARLVLVVIGAAFAAALAYLAVTRVMTFALTLLAVRASLDITNVRQSGTPGGVSGLSATSVSMLLIFAVVVWVAAQHRAGHDGLTALPLAGIALAVAGAMSVVDSIRPIVTLTEAARVTSAIAMLVLLVGLLHSESDMRRVLRTVYLSMVFPLAVAVAQLIMPGTDVGPDGISRIVGTFRHPNALGAYLAVMLVAGVALYQAARDRERHVLAVLLLVGFVVLLLTFSRGSWLATVVGLVTVAIVQRRPRVVVLLTSIMAIATMLPSVSLRLADLGESRTLAGTEGNSLVWRIDYWHQLVGLADQNPATGVGLDMAQFLTVEANLPHNDFVRMYVEAGWIGLLSLLGLLFMLAATARRAAREASTDFEVAVGAGFSGSLASVAVIMVGGNVVSSVVLLWYFFALAACANCVGMRAE